MAKVTIYGIKNCDTMKKARAWLDQRGVAYAFHDYKSAGIDARHARALGAREPGGRRCSTAPAPRSASLPDKDKEGLTEKKAIALMLAQPSMIKRPVLDIGGKLLVGFKAEQYAKAFGGLNIRRRRPRSRGMAAGPAGRQRASARLAITRGEPAPTTGVV